MYKWRQYIAIFLLVGFLFPQGANSAHYFVFQHKVLNTIETQEFSAPAYDYHSCNYQYNSITSILPRIYREIGLFQQNLFKTPASSYLFNYVFELPFNYQLRGPPQV